MKKKTEIVKVVPGSMPAVKGDVEMLISKAIDKGTPVETMEKLMAMRRELKAEMAKEKFDEAMADFQAECPTIKKNKAGGRTKAGEIAYYYAPLEDIVSQVKEIIHTHKFSYTIKPEIKEGRVKVACIVKHFLGHSEISEMEVPLGTQTGVMSAPQVVAAATTFAKRYAFCNAFGILTGDEDTDGILPENNGKASKQRVTFPDEKKEGKDESKKIDEAEKKEDKKGQRAKELSEFAIKLVDSMMQTGMDIYELIKEAGIPQIEVTEMSKGELLALESIYKKKLGAKGGPVESSTPKDDNMIGNLTREEYIQRLKDYAVKLGYNLEFWVKLNYKKSIDEITNAEWPAVWKKLKKAEKRT